jgi:L-lactate utilization protein LutB
VASARRELHNKLPATDAGITGANFLIADMDASCTIKFPSADTGITGANFPTADIAAACTAANERNAELTATPPRIRVVTAGIFVPSIEHTFVLIPVAGPPAEGATQFAPLCSVPTKSSSRAASVSSS